MPGLLDNFLSDPNIAFGASLLSPTKDGGFGSGLSQGLTARQAAVASQDNSQLRQLQAQIREKGLADANAFTSLLGANQAGIQSGDPRAALNLLGGAQNVGQLGGATSLLNAMRPAQRAMTDIEKLQVAFANETDPVRKAQIGKVIELRTTRAPGSSVDVKVDLGGLAEKERTKDFVDAENAAIEQVGKVRSLEGAINTMLQGVAQGAPIGTVANLIGKADVVRSQFNQAINSKAKLEDQIKDLSPENKEEFRNLIDLAMSGKELASQKVSLVYLLAGSRETGKLSDTDLKLAFESVDDGSIEGMISKLIATRQGSIDQLNAKLRTDRERRKPPEGVTTNAFDEFNQDEVFTTEGIKTAPESLIRSLGGMSRQARQKLLSEEQRKALSARILMMGIQ